MIDPFVLLAPVLLLGVVALLRFVGCSFHAHPSIPIPNNVRAQAGIDARITLSWDLVTGVGAVSYKIYRRGGAAQDPIPVPTNGYSDTAVMIGTTYYYKVTTIESDGSESSFSNEVSATPGPITWVQGGAPTERADTANTDNVVTNPFASDVTLGNLIVVWIKYNSNTEQVIPGSGVTDSAGNQYNRAADQTTGMGSLAGWREEIWYATIDQVAPNLTVTAKFTGAFNGKKAISPHEYKWANPTEPLEAAPPGKAGVTANPATVAATDAVMATAARLVFGAAVIQNMGSFGSGFSQRSSQDGDVAEDMPITSLPSSVSATFLVVSPPGMSQDWIAQVATFK
jgi:hypothetical protein